MKRVLRVVAAVGIGFFSGCEKDQTESTETRNDTVKVGNLTDNEASTKDNDNDNTCQKCRDDLPDLESPHTTFVFGWRCWGSCESVVNAKMQEVVDVIRSLFGDSFTTSLRIVEEDGDDGNLWNGWIHSSRAFVTRIDSLGAPGYPLSDGWNHGFDTIEECETNLASYDEWYRTKWNFHIFYSYCRKDIDDDYVGFAPRALIHIGAPESNYFLLMSRVDDEKPGYEIMDQALIPLLNRLRTDYGSVPDVVRQSKNEDWEVRQNVYVNLGSLSHRLKTTGIPAASFVYRTEQECYDGREDYSDYLQTIYSKVYSPVCMQEEFGRWYPKAIVVE